ncbi:MAG: UDP-N-acetylmuramoyl-tripeptide--D-alanyl-D-alanine ligase, partial [Chitinophagales bacterium]
MPLTTKTLYDCFLESNRICTDTRQIKLNDLFFALKGPNFDGNIYASEALKKGAAYVVIDNPDYQKNEKCLLVEDSLKALQDLATYHRKQINPTCVAITGSNGKTTTKELVKAVLSKAHKTQATIGNLNNHIGVPLTLLSLEADTKMAVIEMGANHLYEINLLCSIALPNFGLITNIGKAHLEGFGGLKGVAKGKGELFDFLDTSGGHSFLNMNDFQVSKIGYFIQNASTYGSGAWYKTDVKLVSANPFLKVAWHTKSGDIINIQTQLIGEYNLDNVTAAIAVGTFFQVSSDDVRDAIEAYKPVNKRSQIIKKGSNTIVLDAYNANPTSMEMALKNFSKMKAAHKVAILGDMLEMGKVSKLEHQKILDLAASMDLTKVVVVG